MRPTTRGSWANVVGRVSVPKASPTAAAPSKDEGARRMAPNPRAGDLQSTVGARDFVARSAGPHRSLSSTRHAAPVGFEAHPLAAAAPKGDAAAGDSLPDPSPQIGVTATTTPAPAGDSLPDPSPQTGVPATTTPAPSADMCAASPSALRPRPLSALATPFAMVGPASASSGGTGASADAAPSAVRPLAIVSYTPTSISVCDVRRDRASADGRRSGLPYETHTASLRAPDPIPQGQASEGKGACSENGGACWATTATLGRRFTRFGALLAGMREEIAALRVEGALAALRAARENATTPDGARAEAERAAMRTFVAETKSALDRAPRIRRGAPTRGMPVQAVELATVRLLAHLTTPALVAGLLTFARELRRHPDEWEDRITNKGKSQTDLNYASATAKSEAYNFALGRLAGLCDFRDP
jgi:hypothetical protein